MRKKNLFIAVILGMVFVFTGCNASTANPGTPPEEVIQNNDNSDLQSSESENTKTNYDGAELKNAVTITIGRDGGSEYSLNMYNNTAVDTMLGYLSNEDLLFPTYTYDEEVGFSAQRIRGNYTRDDEQEITDIHAGELYLFSDGQLRLYFKDVIGAKITATPVGYTVDASGIADAVTGAYEENQGDIWAVDVYYHIIKN